MDLHHHGISGPASFLQPQRTGRLSTPKCWTDALLIQCRTRWIRAPAPWTLLAHTLSMCHPGHTYPTWRWSRSRGVRGIRKNGFKVGLSDRPLVSSWFTFGCPQFTDLSRQRHLSVLFLLVKEHPNRWPSSSFLVIPFSLNQSPLPTAKRPKRPTAL